MRVQTGKIPPIMNIHEYQAKELLVKYGIPVSAGKPAFSADEAQKVAKELKSNHFAVKAQIHSGGRGKAGGVKLVKTVEEVRKEAAEMMGKTLVTKQTGPQGKKVSRLLITVAPEIEKEIYLSLIIDRKNQAVTVIASPEGGVDIEETAQTHPEKIIKEKIDPTNGMQPFQARKVAYALGLGEGNLLKQAVPFILSLYRCFVENDCSLIEINPLIIRKDGKLEALDAKMTFDDNALYRHKEIAELRDPAEEDPREVEASQFDLSYIGLNGSIGCMVNGAGLAMATMDIIKLHGGEPANFLDVGGSATQEKVTEAFKLILSDNNVKAVLVNIFGGIMKCDIIANGIVETAKQIGLKIPLVVRLEGTNVELGKEILAKSSLKIISASSMADAAQKAVAAAQ